MKTGRLEAFSDGVIAIIITIMVLELKVPEGADLAALRPHWLLLLSYLLSFIFVGIYWNNHHHLFQVAEKVNGAVLWANLHLLFWLSLLPFAIGWMDESGFAAWPVALYGFLLLCSGIAYVILSQLLIRLHGPTSRLTVALGNDWKGKLSLIGYAVAIPLAFVHPLAALVGYVVVAIIWLIPDRRLEQSIAEHAQ